MKMSCLEPPSCCVIAETEGGALGYRVAVLLDEIGRLARFRRPRRLQNLIWIMHGSLYAK